MERVEDPVDHDYKALRQAAETAIKQRRYTDLTALDRLYVENNEHILEERRHDPIAWFMTYHFPSILKGPTDSSEAINIFITSYQSILAQRNYGNLSLSDDILIKFIQQQLTVWRSQPHKKPPGYLGQLSEFTLSEVELPKFFNSLLADLMNLDSPVVTEAAANEVKNFLDAYEQTLQLRHSEQPWLWGKAASNLPEISQIYMRYLRSLAPQKDEAIDAKKIQKLQTALTDPFLEAYYSGADTFSIGEEEEERQELPPALLQSQMVAVGRESKFMPGRDALIQDALDDFRDIMHAYRNGNDQIKHWYIRKQDHVFTGKIKTQAGREFAKAVHHLAIIGAIPELESLYNSLQQQEGTTIPDIALCLFQGFDALQERYYARIEKYYDSALETLWNTATDQKLGDEPSQAFKNYCEAVLFSDNKEVQARCYEALAAELCDDEDNPDYVTVGKLWHSLRYELKPELEQQKDEANRELKHLKKNIHHFTQANAIHSRIKQRKKAQEMGIAFLDDDDVEADKDAFFQTHYVMLEEQQAETYLTRLQKQYKRGKNHYAQKYGGAIALLVGLGEGIVAGVALGLAFPVAALAAVVGGITVIAGTVLNEFLLRLDSIGLLQVFGFNNFNRDADRKPLETYKQFLNWMFMGLATLGTGVVFAAVFATEFIKMIQGFATTHPALAAAAMPFTYLIAGVIGVAELFGISALIHMANRGLITDGLKSLWNKVADYLVHRFYVPLPGGVGANTWQIIKNLPRLLYSAAITLTGIAIMAYYVKIMYVFFAGMVTDLVAGYVAPILATHLGLTLGAGAAAVIGKIAAGINAVTTLLTFTLPLGKIALKFIDQIALPLALYSIAAVPALIASVFLSPGIFCQGGRKMIGDVWSKLFEIAHNAHAWLTSSSLLVPGGLDHAIKNPPKEKAPSAEAEAGAVELQQLNATSAQTEPEAPQPELGYSKIKHAHEWLNTQWKRLLWVFLGANSGGQGFLLAQKDPLLVDAVVMGGRSLAMNKNGVDKCMAVEQGGNPLGLFKGTTDEGPVQALEAPSYTGLVAAR